MSLENFINESVLDILEMNRVHKQFLILINFLRMNNL